MASTHSGGLNPGSNLVGVVLRLLRKGGMLNHPLQRNLAEAMANPGRFSSILGVIDYDGGPFAFDLTRLSPADCAFLFDVIDSRDCYHLDSVRRERPVILDLGAHIGVFPRVALSRYPEARIVAVEPDPASYQRMKENLAGTPSEQLNLLPQAISTHDGQAKFYISDQVDWRSTLLTNQDFFENPGVSAEEYGRSYSVPSQTLESLLGDLPFDRVDLMKITISGEIEDELLEPSLGEIERLAPEVISIFVYPNNRDRVTEMLKRIDYREIPSRRPPSIMSFRRSGK